MTTSLRVLSFLFLVFLQNTNADVNLNSEPHFLRFLENQSVSNINSSSQGPSKQTTDLPIAEDPAVDPCQNFIPGSSNVFAEQEHEHWEYRYLQCETDDTPCTAESSCCECRLKCIEGFDCTIKPSSPTLEPTAAGGPPSSETNVVDTTNNNNDSSKNSGGGESGSSVNPGIVDGESVIKKTSFTSSSRLDSIAAFASLIILGSCCINAMVILRKLRKAGLDHSRQPIPVDTAAAVTQPGVGGKDDPVYVAKVKRHEDIICKFHFRTIPYRPLDGGSSRSFGSWGTSDSGENSAADLECPASPGSVQRRLQKQKKRLSFWRRQVRKNECCICLENYGPGDTICVPISSSCNHMFHEECVVAWLQSNNRCPLCRVDLMKEVEIAGDPPPSLGQSLPQAPMIPTEITQTEEQMEEPHTSESDEEAHNGESYEDRDVEAPQPTVEETSTNGRDQDLRTVEPHSTEYDEEAHNGESNEDHDVETSQSIEESSLNGQENQDVTAASMATLITQTQEQIEALHSSESYDEESHNGEESNEDHDVEAPQLTEESSLNQECLNGLQDVDGEGGVH